MEKATECLMSIVTFLVDKPEEIIIKPSQDDMGILLTLYVAQEDMGKILGRLGNTAKAIRSIIRVVGMKNGARVSLKIDDPNRESFLRQKKEKSLDESLEGLE